MSFRSCLTKSFWQIIITPDSQWLYILLCFLEKVGGFFHSLSNCTKQNTSINCGVLSGWDSCLRGKSRDNNWSLAISQPYCCDSLFPRLRPPLVPVTQTRAYQFLTRTMKSALIASYSCWSSELTLKFNCFVRLSVVYVPDLSYDFAWFRAAYMVHDSVSE